MLVSRYVARNAMKTVFAFFALIISMTPCGAEALPRVAVFDFDMVNTSPAPTTQEETERLRRLGVQLREALARSGRYDVVDIGPVRQKLATEPAIRGCNGCELTLAMDLGAAYAAFGWVQKVSNLILNINLVIEDAATGRKLHVGSVDIRGNTDESWERGLRYLLRERVLGNSQ
jgi:hypothetical protein